MPQKGQAPLPQPRCLAIRGYHVEPSAKHRKAVVWRVVQLGDRHFSTVARVSQFTSTLPPSALIPGKASALCLASLATAWEQV